MPGRARVLRGVMIRRAVATVRAATLLAGTQVHPRPAGLDALLALMSFRLFDGCDRVDVAAGLIRHGHVSLVKHSPAGRLATGSVALGPRLPRDRASDRHRECFRHPEDN